MLTALAKWWLSFWYYPLPADRQTAYSEGGTQEDLQRLLPRQLIDCVFELRNRMLDLGKEIENLYKKIGTLQIDRDGMLDAHESKIASLQQEVTMWQAAGEHAGIVTPDNLRTWAREVIEQNDEFIATRTELQERIRKCKKRVADLSPKTLTKKRTPRKK